MLPRQQVVDAIVEAHHRWNTGDREGWIAMWHPDCVVDDPVGAPTKHGLASVEQAWDAVAAPPVRLTWPDVPVPYTPTLEMACVVGTEDIVQGVRRVTQLSTARV